MHPVRDAATTWLEPSEAITGDADAVLAPADVASWRERGFALVDGVLPADLVERACKDAHAEFPAAGTRESLAQQDFGSAGRMEFPSSSDAVNAITLHPRLLRAVAQLLGSDETGLRLTQSDLWPKYGHRAAEGGNADQRMHMDYPNHTLTHPPPWDAPEAVEMILYLSEVDICGGATALVPRCGGDDPAYAGPLVKMPGVGHHAWVNDRASAEATLAVEAPELARWRATHLYPREVHARFRVGTLLLYRHDTWHRGTPLQHRTMRLAQNLTFRRATAEWIGVMHTSWAWAMYRPSQVMERIVGSASVAQRCVLGIPAPGHPWWTPETIAAVRARYAPFGIDMSPYERALAREEPTS